MPQCLISLFSVLTAHFQLRHCVTAHWLVGARGSFRWFDRGCLVERMARYFSGQERSGVRTREGDGPSFKVRVAVAVPLRTT